MKKFFGVVVVLLLAVSFLAACGPGTPAEFTLSSVTVSPSAPVVNDTVTIGTTVTNAGEQSGDCDVSLTIGDYTDSKSVSALAGGASSSVSFSYAATTAGDYTATLSTPDDSKSKSFTVSEEGVTPPEGGVPVLSVGDEWTYGVSYADPGGLTEQDTGELSVAMVDEVEVGGEASYHLSGAYVPPGTRDATLPGLVLTVGDADIWTSKAHMEYLKQSSAIAQLPGLPSTITWTYTGDYGWPYDVGKTWSYTARTVAGPIDESVDRESKVLEIVDVTVPAGTFSCYHIVSYDPASPDTYANENWVNATVKSNVKMIVRDTWAGEETMELSSYSVS